MNSILSASHAIFILYPHACARLCFTCMRMYSFLMHMKQRAEAGNLELNTQCMSRHGLPTVCIHVVVVSFPDSLSKKRFWILLL